MSLNASYEFANVNRDVSAAFQLLIENTPTLISRVAVGPQIANTKHEWLKRSLSQTQGTVSAVTGSGSGTSITVDASLGFQANDIVRAEKATGGSYSEVMKVTAYDSGTGVLTVVRGYGSSGTEVIAATDKIILVSSAYAEGSTAGSGTNGEAGLEYNYTQIFSKTVDVTATAAEVAKRGGMIGVGDLVAQEAEVKMQELMRDINNAIIYGRRVQRSSSEVGTAGGFMQYATATAVGGALTATVINTALQTIMTNGAMSSNLALVVAPLQARKISAFNTAGTNPITQRLANDTTTGQYVNTFVGDIPIGQGFTAAVFVDPNFPKDRAALVDLTRVQRRPLRPLADLDATNADYDGIKRRLICEETFEFRDAAKAHALLTGLTL